jgi:protein-tyrosine phosphatase
MIKHILVVCIGNICRSPMAEALLKQALPACTISSAGLGALVGLQADPHAQTVMRARGLDISEHRARQVEDRMLNEADLVFVMDQKQKQHIENAFPFARGKVFRLGEPNNADIADPYQQEFAVFQETAVLIAHNVSAWANRIHSIL